MMVLRQWPWPLDAVHLQNQRSVDTGLYAKFAGPRAYKTFLLNPPAPAYSFQSLLPVASYEGLRRRSWWQTAFQKFGLQGLKLINDFAGPNTNRTPVAILDHGSHPSSHRDLLQAAYPSGDNAVSMFMGVAEWALRIRGRVVLANYLGELTLEAIMPAVEERRLGSESRTWDRTYDQEIGGLAAKTLVDFRAMDQLLQDFASTAPADRPHMKLPDVNTSLNLVFRNDVLDFHRMDRVPYRSPRCLPPPPPSTDVP